MKKILILTALTAIAAASSMQPAYAQSSVTHTALVEHRDLDLRTEAGARTLKLRVWRAVVDVCGTTSEFDIAGKNDIRQCRRDTLATASAQADLAIAGVSRDQPVRVASIRD